MRKVIFVIVFLLLLGSAAFAGHKYKEKDYQKAWCEGHGGILEYVLDDGARVDCLLPDYAVEFDFCSKWAESIGQALYYALKTGRKAGVVLIMENPEKEGQYVKRLKAVAEKYNITVWVVTPSDM